MMSSATPIRNGQVSDLIAILLPPEIAAVKIEAHTKKIEPHYQSVAITDFHAKAAATEYVNIVAFVDEIHSASSEELTSCCQTFPILISCNMATDCS